MGSVAIDHGGDVVEPRFAPRRELPPETARLLGPEESHIERAVVVPIFERAEGPAARGYLEPERRLDSRIETDLCRRAFQKSIAPPDGDINRVFA